MSCRRKGGALPYFVLACSLGAPVSVRADEGRIPVFRSGSVLVADGSYLLTRNFLEFTPELSTPAWLLLEGLRIDLDLNGMVIAPASPATLINAANGFDVRIHNGTLIVTGSPIFASSVRRLVLEDLRIVCTGGSSAAIGLLDVANVVIRRVEISGCTGSLRGSIDIGGAITVSAVIEDNVIHQSSGIYVEYGSNVSISRNRLEGSGSPGSAAINIFSSSACRIVDNVIDAPEEIGIKVATSDSTILSGNVIRNSATHGVLVDLSSVNNLIDGNSVSLSGSPRGPGDCSMSDGLVVEGSRNFIMANSLMENCRYGLHLGYRNGNGTACSNVLGENSAGGNVGFGVLIPGGCIGHPPLFPPDSCDSVGDPFGMSLCNQSYPNSTFGDNRILPAY